MQFYCASFEKNTVNKRSSVTRTKQNRLLSASSCATCGKKKLRLIKIQ